MVERGFKAAVAALLFAGAVAPALAVDMPEACDYAPPKSGTEAKPFDISVSSASVELENDYIFRGVTLSAHQPSVAASIEVDRGPFYFMFQPQSVRLPTNPWAELGFAGGFCNKIGKDAKLDLGVIYYYYPGETPVGPVTSTSYGEAHAAIAYEPTEMLTLSAMYGFSPSYSNSGAWEHYVEGGFEIHLDKVFPDLLPKDLAWSFSGNLGQSWFGDQSASLGGFPLPSYANWSLGLTFEFDPFTLDLVYSNTNLTKENCFVFTGDPGATPGGAVNPVTNPLGLQSNWCGPAFVGKLTYDFVTGK